MDTLTLERIHWAGSLDEISFLARLYDLESLPSHDIRYHRRRGHPSASPQQPRLGRRLGLRRRALRADDRPGRAVPAIPGRDVGSRCSTQPRRCPKAGPAAQQRADTRWLRASGDGPHQRTTRLHRSCHSQSYVTGLSGAELGALSRGTAAHPHRQRAVRLGLQRRVRDRRGVVRRPRSDAVGAPTDGRNGYSVPSRS